MQNILSNFKIHKKERTGRVFVERGSKCRMNFLDCRNRNVPSLDECGAPKSRSPTRYLQSGGRKVHTS
jgi:hypothetical protein